MLDKSTRKYYESHANEYFSITRSINLEHLWNKLTQNLNAYDFVLDLGCGSGRDVSYFSRQNFNVIGFDYSFNLLKLAQGITAQPLILGDIRYLPFKHDTFDAIWAIGSLLHISRQSMAPTLTKIHRVLKTNAILLTSMKKGMGEETDAMGRFNVFYQPHEWASLLIKNDFEILELEETTEFRDGKSGKSKEVTWIVSLARSN